MVLGGSYRFFVDVGLEEEEGVGEEVWVVEGCVVVVVVRFDEEGVGDDGLGEERCSKGGFDEDGFGEEGFGEEGSGVKGFNGESTGDENSDE